MTDFTAQETRTLGEEYDRLDAELDAGVDPILNADDLDETETGASIVQSVSTTQAALGGVSLLINGNDRGFDGYDRDAEVTVEGLTAGGFAKVDDWMADVQAHNDGPGDNPGTRRNVWVAAGLVDAPFLEPGELSGGDPFEDKVATVAELPEGVAKWLYEWIDDLTTLGRQDFRSFSERLKAAQEG
ncbi:hypothetical protein ACFQL1_01580 [Halomicroarcula sp. GCM10025709]|uniref:hypothetical protein n=1 Tax=Haloarcula TaxID=2237 RepID=UPI0024C3017D|nr:hypothetical protein [Halomicroarcula sp. YJ-61-S]